MVSIIEIFYLFTELTPRFSYFRFTDGVLSA